MSGVYAVHDEHCTTLKCVDLRSLLVHWSMPCKLFVVCSLMRVQPEGSSSSWACISTMSVKLSPARTDICFGVYDSSSLKSKYSAISCAHLCSLSLYACWHRRFLSDSINIVWHNATGVHCSSQATMHSTCTMQHSCLCWLPRFDNLQIEC